MRGSITKNKKGGWLSDRKISALNHRLAVPIFNFRRIIRSFLQL